MLYEIMERLEPIAVHKNITIAKEMISESNISGDRESLNAAFLNIFDNAVKFTPANGRIMLMMSSKNGTLNVSLTNTFDALPEGDLIRIFEPFYRSKSPNISGSGLGLSIAARIIQKHGGKIEAFNSPDGLEIRVSFTTEA
jgi:signal transduction histidine kinase